MGEGGPKGVEVGVVEGVGLTVAVGVGVRTVGVGLKAAVDGVVGVGVVASGDGASVGSQKLPGATSGSTGSSNTSG